MTYIMYKVDFNLLTIVVTMHNNLINILKHYFKLSQLEKK